jgi:hypothetical protein
MGWSSVADLIAELGAGKVERSIAQFTLPVAGAAGTWRDLTQHSTQSFGNIWGERCKNGFFNNGGVDWTLGTGWSVTTAALHSSATVLSSITQTPTIPIVAGRTYRTVFTSAGVSGSGSFRIKLGGTAGTDRSTNNTFIENIVAGASGIIEVSCDAARGVSIDGISVMEVLGFTPYTDRCFYGQYAGNAVSAETKHVLAAWSSTIAAAGSPCVLMLCDMLGCYPGIDMNTGSLQTLVNNDALPRYTDGVGVKAFFTITAATSSTPYTFNLVKYTNTVPTAGRVSQQFPLSGATSAGIGYMPFAVVHPFLQMQDGDLGIRSVQEVQLSTGSGAGTSALVLCRPLLTIPMISPNAWHEKRFFLNGIPSLPRVYDGAYLGWLFYGAQTTPVSSVYRIALELGWG